MTCQTGLVYVCFLSFKDLFIFRPGFVAHILMWALWLPSSMCVQFSQWPEGGGGLLGAGDPGTCEQNPSPLGCGQCSLLTISLVPLFSLMRQILLCCQTGLTFAVLHVQAPAWSVLHLSVDARDHTPVVGPGDRHLYPLRWLTSLCFLLKHPLCACETVLSPGHPLASVSHRTHLHILNIRPASFLSP